MAISIKISDENYQLLSRISGKLQAQRAHPVSLNDAISHLARKGGIAELAGTWKMTEKEATALKKNLREGWQSWRSA